MKQNFAYCLLFLTLATSSCTQKPNYGNPVVSPDTILKNMITFLDYRERNVMLSEDFTALNPESEIISKGAFLKFLASGEYLPLRLVSKDSSNYYQLYKLNSSDNADIRMTLKGWGSQESELYELEGTKFPGFILLTPKAMYTAMKQPKGKYWY